MPFQIKPLRADFLQKVREQGIDDQGQPVRRLVSAQGGEPCRDVLRRARPGENLILASYSPFEQGGPYKEYGPVFILAEASDEEVTLDIVPSAQGKPDSYFISPFILRAYNANQDIVGGKLVSTVTDDEIHTLLTELFNRPEVAFVHARYKVAGCFSCHIEKI